LNESNVLDESIRPLVNQDEIDKDFYKSRQIIEEELEDDEDIRIEAQEQGPEDDLELLSPESPTKM